MSDKMQGGILAGSTSVSLCAILRKTADNTEKTGVAAAGVTSAYYWRQGGSPTTISALSDLAAINSAFAAGGWKEADATHLPGAYRLDVDNAAFATGADWVEIGIVVASCYVYHERFALTTNVIQTGDSYGRLGANGAGLSAIPDEAGVATLLGRLTSGRATNLDNLDTTVSSRGTATLGNQTTINNNVLALGSPMQAGATATLATAQPNYAPSKAGDAMTLTSGERGTLAGVILTTVSEGTETVIQTFRIIRSAVVGLCSGFPTASPARFRDAGNTKDRIVVTADANGNRSAVSADGS